MLVLRNSRVSRICTHTLYIMGLLRVSSQYLKTTVANYMNCLLLVTMVPMRMSEESRKFFDLGLTQGNLHGEGNQFARLCRKSMGM